MLIYELVIYVNLYTQSNFVRINLDKASPLRIISRQLLIHHTKIINYHMPKLF